MRLAEVQFQRFVGFHQFSGENESPLIMAISAGIASEVRQPNERGGRTGEYWLPTLDTFRTFAA